MNKDVFEGKRKERQGQVKRRRGKLTDDDLEQAVGKAEQLTGLIQQQSGHTPVHAEEEFQQHGQTMLDAGQDFPAWRAYPDPLFPGESRLY